MKLAKTFDALVTLFPKTIKVTLVDAIEGSTIGMHKIPSSQLPAIFNKPTTLFIDNTHWRILNANPISADDFISSKKLTLQVVRSTPANEQQLLYTLPTIANEFPATCTEGLYDQFNLNLDIAQWRQVEFLPLSESPAISETITEVEKILGMQSNALRGYKDQYKREKVNDLFLHIPIQDIYPLLYSPVTGSIVLKDEVFVQNGFAIQSENHTYYGIVEGSQIRTLCLREFDYVDDELMRVLSAFNLSLIDWCNASRISAEEGEKPRSEFIKSPFD